MSWSGKTKSPSHRLFPVTLLLTEEPPHPSREIRESSWPQAYYSVGVSYSVDITLAQAGLTTCERKMAGENRQSTQHLSRLPVSKRLQTVPTCDVLFGPRRYLHICTASLFCGRKSRYLIRFLVKSPHFSPFSSFGVCCFSWALQGCHMLKRSTVIALAGVSATL